MATGHVEIVYSPRPREVVSWTVALVELPAHATVADAINASGLRQSPDGPAAIADHVGVWGRRASLETEIRDGDRVEIYRPLRIDPKEARRLRYRQQGPVKSRHRAGGQR